MKYLLIITFLLFAINLNSDELKWVDDQVEAIKPPRKGISDENISMLKDPFYFAKEKKSPKSKTSVSSTKSPTKYKRPTRTTTYVLKSIMNQSALINGKWYTINDKVGLYTLSEVKRNSVTLSYKNKKLVLSTVSKIKNLKFNNK